jgi:hypothetical protein
LSSLVLLLVHTPQLIFSCFLLNVAHAVEPAAFMQSYCVDCHGPTKQKAERRFDELVWRPQTQAQVQDLQDALDQLNLGEMPPKKAPQPSNAEHKAMVERLTGAIAEAHLRLRSTGGVSVLRRLNRREYLNTVGDLFSLDMRLFDPTQKFPKDQMAEHLDTLGDVLQTSGYLLSQYLEAADAVVERAVPSLPRVAERSWQFSRNFIPQAEHTYPHRKVFNNAFLVLYEVPDTSSHEGGYVSVHAFREGVPADGEYEIQVRAEALHRSHPYDPKIFGRKTEQPFRLGVVPGDMKVGPLNHPQPIEPRLAEVTVKDGPPQWHTVKVRLNAGQTPRFIFPNGMANSRGAFLQVARRYADQWPAAERADLGIFEARRVVLQHGQFPQLRIHEVKVRGPLPEMKPSAWTLLSAQPFDAARTEALLRSFADRAYRRAASVEEVQHLLRVVQQRGAAGQLPLEALKDGLKAALCSPAFLYLETGDKVQLSAHAYAARLSYFLWASQPDDELRALADSGELLQPEVKVAQLRRLLASPRALAFEESFLDSWLNLRALGDMPPDRDAFEQFYAADLKTSMRRESQLFFHHLIEQDLSITQFLQADFTFVNQALADLYDLGQVLPPERAQEFALVKLSDPRRGGLLGQASVLTVTANGIETSPVRRGVWLLENVLGTPTPPPPDDVPDIDPDIRGATTIRSLLEKHRSNVGCMECHQKIDPPGFALENYDPTGRWRSHYPGEKKRKGALIDPTGQMPSGEIVRDVADLKHVLLNRKEGFARMLTQRLLSYACGRRVESSDRPAVDALPS